MFADSIQLRRRGRGLAWRPAMRRAPCGPWRWSGREAASPAAPSTRRSSSGTRACASTPREKLQSSIPELPARLCLSSPVEQGFVTSSLIETLSAELGHTGAEPASLVDCMTCRQPAPTHRSSAPPAPSPARRILPRKASPKEKSEGVYPGLRALIVFFLQSWQHLSM